MEDFSDKRTSIFELTAYSFDLTFSLNESSSQALKTGHLSFHLPGSPKTHRSNRTEAFYAWFLWWKLGRAICHVSNGTWALKLMMLTHHAPWLDQEGNRLLGKIPEKCLGFRWSWMDIYIYIYRCTYIHIYFWDTRLIISFIYIYIITKSHYKDLEGWDEYPQILWSSDSTEDCGTV